MRSADPKTIPIEQLTTDQHTRVHIPPYKTLRLAFEKNIRSDEACSTNGDNDCFPNDLSILHLNPIQVSPYISIHADRIANQLSCGVSTSDADDALSHQVVVYRHRLSILLVSLMHALSVQSPVARERCIVAFPKIGKASE